MSEAGESPSAGPGSVGARRTTADIAIQLVGRVLNLGLGAVVTVVMVRALGDAGFGQWSTLFAIVGIVGYLGSFGIAEVAVRRAASEPARELEWVGALISLRTTLAVVTSVIAFGAVALLAHNTEMLVAGGIIAATLPLNGPRAMKAMFQLRVRNDLEIVALTVNSVVWGAAVLVIAAMDQGVVALAFAFFGAAVLHTALVVALGLRLGRPKLAGSHRLWADLVRVGIPVGIAGVITMAYASVDQVMVFEIAGEVEAGLYGAAYRLLDQAHILPISFMTTLFPIISAAYPLDMQRVRGLVQSTAEYLAMASLPILAFTIVAAGPTVRLLYGDEFSPAAPALPVLMAAFVLIAFGYLAGNLIIVLELQRRFIKYALAALALNVVLNALLIPPYGFVAAAWTTLATELLVLGLAGRAVLTTLDMRPALGRLPRTAVAALAMGAGVAVIALLGAPLGAQIALAAVSYPLLLLSLGVVQRSEIADLARRRPPAEIGQA